MSSVSEMTTKKKKMNNAEWDESYWRLLEANRPEQIKGRPTLPTPEEVLKFRPPANPSKVLAHLADDYALVAQQPTAIELVKVLCERGWHVQKASGAGIAVYPSHGAEFLSSLAYVSIYPTGGGCLSAGQATVEFRVIESRGLFFQSWRIWSGISNVSDLGVLEQYRVSSKQP